MTKFYVASNGKPTGPFTTEELRTMNITPETLVWQPELPDWVKAGDIDIIRIEVFRMPPINNPNRQFYPNQGYNSYPNNAPNQGYNYNQTSRSIPPCPSTYMVWAILMMICCCLPIGIVALIYSTQVEPKYRQGDYLGAEEASEKARKWLIGGLIVGIISNILAVIFYGMMITTPSAYNLYNI